VWVIDISPVDKIISQKNLQINNEVEDLIEINVVINISHLDKIYLNIKPLQNYVYNSVQR